MILNEGSMNGKTVLSKRSIIEMQQNRVSKDASIAYTPAEAGNWGYGFGEWVMDSPIQASTEKEAMPSSQRSTEVTSPGLFGSFPWVNNTLHYAGFLFTFNINHKGRHDRYSELKKTIDEIMKKNNP